MKFNLDKSIEILERTPYVIEELLNNLSEEWTMNNEGAGTWSPYDIVGHLIHGEKTDWIPRMEIILSENANKRFEPFDMSAHLKNTNKVPLNNLLGELKTLRYNNIIILKSRKLRESDMSKTGVHPEFGLVSLQQLIATWAVHDLTHIAQITRVMAKQYKTETGPWERYLPLLHK
jgi:hypothetical protein